MFTRELDQASRSVQQTLQHLQIAVPEQIEWFPTPIKGHWGFGTNACFKAAAAEARSGKKINVQTRAHEIAEALAEGFEKPQGFERVEAERGYLNIYIDPSVYIKRVTDTVIEQGEEFGRGAPKGERVMVEYAQPNTHHSFHIGHARNAVLGESLARLVEFAGFETVRASYPGDMGLGVITCIWAYDKFFKGQEPEGIHERGQWLAKIYTEATQLVTPKADETPEERAQREGYEEERRELYQRWDSQDPEIRELWLETRQWSLDELEDILQMLGIKIDVYFFESEAAEPAKAIVEELIQFGIAEDERPDGPVFVNIDEKLGLKKEKYRTAVILRSDGTTLYSTNDLALAKKKFEEYHVDRSIYVVDVRQSLHFQQVFKILELWGFPQAKYCYHLAHGIVTLPEGAMSARLGNVVFFMDVLEEAQRRVLEVIAEKNPGLDVKKRDEVARQVGLGALIYSMLSVDNIKDIVFDWDSALSFDGQSAPYIQNAYVRANSILRKIDQLPSEASFSYDLHPAEVELIELISQFPALVEKSATEYKPLHMASYTYDLARSFHTFYHSVRVLQAESDDIMKARLRITASARQTLANALRLLSIEAPEVM
ncbi:MAG: arginine--tRNA ligase [Anaerolineales bacterium]|nr:arginine--tRNA ligase [Anaerolineales bacterium]